MNEIFGDFITFGLVLITFEKLGEIMITFFNMTARFTKGGLT